MINTDLIKFDAAGLVPVVVQDAKSAEVLMVAWANAEALKLTAETGELVAADWEAVDRQQLNLLDLLNQGGNALETAMVAIAQQQVAQASHAYQRTLNAGLSQVLAGNVGKLTSPPPSARSSVA